MSIAWRTRAFCALAALRNRTPVAERTLEQIKADRRLEPPHRFPFDRIFGRVPAGLVLGADRASTRWGMVPVRTYQTRARVRPSPVVVFFHGGGWMQGSVGGYDALCGQTADRTGALVVSVDYRLAPEHPFPAAVQDCYDVTRWVGEQGGALGIDPARLAVMGDSAGGNLAAVVAQLARDAGGPPIVAQVLIYPATDATFSSPSIHSNAHAPMLTRRDMHGFIDRYIPDGDRTDPRVSPLLAPDLSRLPRALVQTAELDPLRDDGARYAQAMAAHGVRVRYTEYADVPHGFVSFPGAVLCGEQSLREIVAELKDAFR